MAKSRIGKVIAVIPDVQAKPGVSNDHLEWVGNYLAEKRPDVVVCIGDFADLPSLSSYDRGKGAAEGQRVAADIGAAQAAMKRLMAPIRAVRGYRPRLVLTLGNHEQRLDRYAEDNPSLIGTLSSGSLAYETWGWEVVPFLEVITIEGVEFSHYFTSGPMGRPVSSAAALMKQRQASAVMGHVQKVEMSFHPSGKIAMFVGCCYTHDETYLTPQGNRCRRQLVMLHEVRDGIFDPMFCSLEYLKRRYS